MANLVAAASVAVGVVLVGGVVGFFGEVAHGIVGVVDVFGGTA